MAVFAAGATRSCGLALEGLESVQLPLFVGLISALAGMTRAVDVEAYSRAETVVASKASAVPRQ